jgi:membrane associated rhomboid family serine protease
MRREATLTKPIPHRGGLGTATSATLLVISVICLCAQRGIGVSPQEWVDQIGIVPARALQANGMYQIFTYGLLHVDTWHWLQNAIGLAIFGSAFEKQTSSWSLIGIAVLGIALSGLAHVLIYPDSQLPLVGFSGAIAALIGAVLVRSVPFAWLQWVVGLFALLTIIALALAALRGNLPLPQPGDPAHVAHVAGLAVGIGYHFLNRVWSVIAIRYE